jgi:hypothetical protein
MVDGMVGALDESWWIKTLSTSECA